MSEREGLCLYNLSDSNKSTTFFSFNLRSLFLAYDRKFFNPNSLVPMNGRESEGIACSIKYEYISNASGILRELGPNPHTSLKYTITSESGSANNCLMNCVSQNSLSEI